MTLVSSSRLRALVKPSVRKRSPASRCDRVPRAITTPSAEENAPHESGMSTKKPTDWPGVQLRIEGNTAHAAASRYATISGASAGTHAAAHARIG